MKRNVRAAILVLFSCLMAMVLLNVSPALAGVKTPVRAFHFVLRAVTLEKARWMTNEAKRAGFNAVVVNLTDGVQFDHAPWKPLPDAWTKAEFLAWVKEARDLGLEVIPGVQLLTHQERLFQDRQPKLMFNRSTYDPRNEETYKLAFALLDDIIAGIRPAVVHICHDEVAGHNPDSGKKWLRPGEKMLPAELFLKDVLRVHDYLKKQGIETWMWADMLIDPSEFPGMDPAYLHGSFPGYGKALRDKLPRDIVLCDWHFTDSQLDFPSLSAMLKEGFRTIGTTWKKESTIRNFSRYAAQQGAYGMMATTWFYVQRKEWDVVGNIIRTSGDAFLRDFPDTVQK